jgi:hypothetical protein
VDVAIRELDPELREVLILHFLEGRTTREIAAAWNISQATISRRIGSGVEQLRAKLRRRGILVAVGALSALLGDNAVQAAPLPLLAELGKMAIVGGAASVGAGAGSGLGTITTGALTALKTKAVAVAAVAVISVGSAVTYYGMTKSPPEPPSAANVPRRLAPPDNLPQAETQWDLPTSVAQNQLHGSDRAVLIPQASDAASLTPGRTESAAAVKYGGMMGRMMGTFAPSPNDHRGRQSEQTGGIHSQPVSHQGGPDRSNDPNDRDPNDPRRP